ncbi:MAG: hypothetical protein MZV70_20000 [Desulfobacterales bacterium]|nr:hypothetical protein [Desulfobacterales bacterium]
MDVMMPQAGGVTLFQEIKKDEQLKHIPVIMLTGVSAKAFAHHLKMLNVRARRRPAAAGCLHGKTARPGSHDVRPARRLHPRRAPARLSA